MENLEELFRKIGVVPVIAIKDADTAVPLAKALVKGGLPAAEVTFRTDAAEESIRRMAAEVPEIYVCAGTVLDPETAERAVKAGARAIISPGLNLDTVDWCLSHDVPVIPGVKPLSTLRQLTLLPETFAIELPEALRSEVRAHADRPEVIRRIGVEWAVDQCRRLKAAGVPMIHFYTMGRAENVRQIIKEVF